MNTSFDIGAFPVWLTVALGLLIVVQLALEIYALVKLFRTPDERLVFGSKLPWVFIILLVNLVGAIAFLVAGTKPDQVADPLRSAAPVPTPDPSMVLPGAPTDSPAGPDRPSAAARAADVLYGREEGE